MRRDPIYIEYDDGIGNTIEYLRMPRHHLNQIIDQLLGARRLHLDIRWLEDPVDIAWFSCGIAQARCQQAAAQHEKLAPRRTGRQTQQMVRGPAADMIPRFMALTVLKKGIGRYKGACLMPQCGIEDSFGWFSLSAIS